MKIAIIGSGNVGKHLAAGLSHFQHTVSLGTRDPSKLEQFAKDHPEVRVGGYAQVVEKAQMVILAVNFDAIRSVISQIGKDSLSNKIIIDLSNPLEFSGGEPALSLGWNTSAGESVQQYLPHSHVVKALSACGVNSMLQPRERIGGEPEMPIAGENAEAKRIVTQFLQDLGWTVVDLGGIKRSRLIEPMTLIGILDNFRTGWTKDHQGWKFLNVAPH